MVRPQGGWYAQEPLHHGTGNDLAVSVQLRPLRHRPRRGERSLWRAFKAGEGAPPRALRCRLPAVAMTAGGLDAAVAVFIVAANTLAGIGFGWVYRRQGLEMAMLAHALAPIVNCVFVAA